ncbi:MAG: DNA methylase [Treponema sp.]|nr:DNA methylase [Treponema sp.]
MKSFFASVECVSRGLDPLTAKLVVADTTRSDTTICLAVTPALKALGVPGRPRLFEVKQKIKDINEKTWPPVEYIAATPRMAEYIRVSNLVYETYLKYVSPEDIHVYSIDEVFIDATGYLKLYDCSPHDLAMRMIQDVLSRTGITATAGIGTNMYLAKVAMDIVAKHIPADKDGVRIAELDEYSYREKLWDHTPITDFWRVGAGIAKRLASHELYTMGDIARCSVGKKPGPGIVGDYYNEDILYKEFGINAELLIDHAWGFENCRIRDVKAYRPKNHSLSNGQVLPHGYTYENTKLVVKEMAEELAFTLVSKHMVTNQIVLYLGYDIANLRNAGIRAEYTGKCNFSAELPSEVTSGIKIERDHWGREIPGSVGGRSSFDIFTSSGRLISAMAENILERITPEQSRCLLVRRINICAANVMTEEQAQKMEKEKVVQGDLFEDVDEAKRFHEFIVRELGKEKSIQESVLEMKQRYGKNAVFKGMDLQEEATTLTRNAQIGGHRA